MVVARNLANAHLALPHLDGLAVRDSTGHAEETRNTFVHIRDKLFPTFAGMAQVALSAVDRLAGSARQTKRQLK